MNLFAIAGLSVTISCFILFLITLIYGRTKLHWLLLGLNIVIGIWGFGTFLAARADSIISVLPAWRLAISGGIFVSVIFYHIVCVFTGIRRKINIILVYSQAVIFSSLCLFTNSVITKIKLVYSLFFPQANPLLVFIILSWAIIVYLSFRELFKFLKVIEGEQRKQTMYLFFGFLIGFIGGGSVLLPILGVYLYPIGNFLVPIYIFVVTYTFLKYRLIDIKVGISRVSIFTMIFAFIIGIPIGLIFLNPFAVAGLSVAISCSALALLALLMGKNNIQRILAFFNIIVAIWGLGGFIVGIAHTEKMAIFGWKIAHVGGFFIGPLFYHVVSLFCGIYRKRLIYFAYIQAIFFEWFNISTSQLVNKTRFVFGVYYNEVTLFLLAGILFYLIFIFLSYYELIKFLRKVKGNQRIQTLYMIFGFLCGFVGGTSTFLPEFRIDIFYPIGNFGIFLYCLIVTYAILKHRILDIRIAVTRTAVFVIVYTLVLGLPFLAGAVYQQNLKLLVGDNWWMLPLGLMAVLATVGPVIYNSLRRRAENIILKEQRYYQQILTNLSKSMINIRDLEHLLKTISLTIIQAVKVPFSAIYLKDDEHQGYRLKNCYPQEIKSKFQEFIPFEDPLIEVLNKQKRPLFSEEVGHQDKIYLDSGLVIPCFGKEGLLGLMVLGAKTNGQIYTVDDLLVFENLSYSTSFAIENCIYWKEIENSQRLARIEEMNLFSYSLAHEIDNPMTIIIGNAGKINRFYADDMNLSESHKKELKITFDEISEAAWRVSGMVKAIQEFGEKTSGELKPVNLKDTIATFLKLYTPHFKMNAVDFTMEVPAELPLIMGVSQEIEQVLVIFSNNAVHALLGVKDKKINLKVEVVNQRWIKIILSDNGYGIPKGNLLTIFSAFVTTKASSEGTGMGLYNAKNIINRHNGKIWAESEGEGKGAKFIIELPIAKDIKPEEPKEEKKGSREY